MSALMFSTWDMQRATKASAAWMAMAPSHAASVTSVKSSMTASEKSLTYKAKGNSSETCVGLDHSTRVEEAPRKLP